uniref:Calx-beta domain-containing protein n=1 Tax=Romanomermis culicivorax TaxID=13658 RepID=A0A915JZL2_ROMCU
MRSDAYGENEKEILTIEFAAKTYAFDHGDQERIRLKIMRRGCLRKTALFRCCTLSGTAKKNEHFLPKLETLFFNRNETEKFVTVDLMGGPASPWSAHDSFQVRLELDSSHADDPRTQVGKCCTAKVTFEPANSENKDSVINFK